MHSNPNTLKFCLSIPFHVFKLVGIQSQQGWTENRSREIPNGSFDLTKCFTPHGQPIGGDFQYPDLDQRPSYMHSFAMTENYIILFLSPWLFDYCFSMGLYQIDAF